MGLFLQRNSPLASLWFLQFRLNWNIIYILIKAIVMANNVQGMEHSFPEYGSGLFIYYPTMFSGDPLTNIMMTSSNGNIFLVTGPLCGEFTGPGEFPAQRPETQSFDVFFDLRLDKPLRKQPWGWWFETPSWSLRRHCNVNFLKFCKG